MTILHVVAPHSTLILQHHESVLYPNSCPFAPVLSFLGLELVPPKCVRRHVAS